MKTLLRVFFHLLYHSFAFTYDLVAGIVSLGHWREWILEVVPFIHGTRTLEIGHGPGHLHRFLLRRGLVAVALDESAAMSRLARRRALAKDADQLAAPSHMQPSQHPGCTQINLTRGLAQALPFRDGAFETVLATFPAEYIADPQTLSEVRRCLSDGGRFVVLPAALPRNRLLAWLFRVTGQAPSDAVQVIQQKLQEPFIQAAFETKMHVLERTSGTLIIVVAEKKEKYVQKTS
ncbi:MAG: class I SAM-dependent methyltransferase [Chloroflexota bacterium]